MGKHYYISIDLIIGMDKSSNLGIFDATAISQSEWFHAKGDDFLLIGTFTLHSMDTNGGG